MSEKAGNDEQAKERIRAKQVIGIERRSDMFSHAISNMMMRGDGKSNIFRGDAFDPTIQEKVKSLKPTVTMLNPPYDVGAAGQLQFIENALNIVGRGRCVVICQMSAAVQQKPEIAIMRARLMKAHTLEGVVSMPSDLFHPVGVVTCVMVFRAGEPHPAGFTSYFGYWRDDGFVKRKHKGRISDGTWPDKKLNMVTSFQNRESRPGFSIMRAVGPHNEWCAEAYMQTNYHDLKDAEFVRAIKNYVAFRLIESANPAPVSAARASEIPHLSLWDRPWREFRFKALFEVRKGKRLTKADMEEGETPFIGAVEINNGLTGRIAEEPRHLANTITVVYNGNGVAEAFYQPEPFWCTDDVNVLYPNFALSAKIALFLATVIRREKYRFSYGRKWGKERMQESILNLPVDGTGKPDWTFMEAYIDTLPFSADL
jgi:type I restriction enzyme M protein